MASWRARVKVPCEVDQWVRNQASATHVKLKDFLGSIIVSGLGTISRQGTAYEFLHTQLAAETVFVDEEYVVDEFYRNEVQSQSHLLTRGKGKQQKIFLETLLIAHAAFQAAQTAAELADGLDEDLPSEKSPSDDGSASEPPQNPTEPL